MYDIERSSIPPASNWNISFPGIEVNNTQLHKGSIPSGTKQNPGGHIWPVTKAVYLACVKDGNIPKSTISHCTNKTIASNDHVGSNANIKSCGTEQKN